MATLSPLIESLNHVNSASLSFANGTKMEYSSVVSVFKFILS